ncbi:MAG: IS66 family transposase [Rhodocyclaceae bacterium]|nr:IS66 family transposase [Rhodocyclaceae bacterium]
MRVRELEQRHQQALAEQTAAFHQRILEMFEEIRLARRRMFGPSSEVLSAQGRLFDEVEVEASQSTPADDTVALPPPAAPANPGAASGKASTRRGKRVPLPADLPRVEVIHDVPLAERTCPCGTPMVEIGTDVSEQLDIVPMQVRVLRHLRKRYGCPRGEHAPVVAPVAPSVLPRSNASAGLLATLIVAKYVDGLPLARLEYVLARHGAKVPRQTQARWMIGCAQKLIPLVNLMRDSLFDGSVIYMDETTVQVLKEPGRAASSNSFMWVQRGGPPGRPVVLFDYDPSRSGQIPVRQLEGWSGFLMTDGYDGYNALARQPGVEHLVCWAHVRRRFMDAAKVLPAGKRGHAHRALELIGQLYAIERECRTLSDAERAAQRQARSDPILAQLRTWLDAVCPSVPPQSTLGGALRYMHDFWPKLVRYTQRGDLPIDNNPAENAIRPFVTGRKNWLFADTPAGATASARLYSLLETAKANSIEPYLWLRHVLSRIPYANSLADYEALLPWNLRVEDLSAEFKS